MFICHGHNKAVVTIDVTPACDEAMDMLLQRCRMIQRTRRSDVLYLMFGYEEYIPLHTDETLFMAVEMCVRYWWASCDQERVFPVWMQEAEAEMYISEKEEESEESSDSWYSDGYDDGYVSY